MSLSSRSRMRMRSARNQERGCVFLRLLSPTRKTPASIFRRLPRWCNPCESCPMNHWQWDPRSSLRMRLRILLEESFVFACCLLPTPCAKMHFCLSAPAHCWKQPNLRRLGARLGLDFGAIAPAHKKKPLRLARPFFYTKGRPNH